MFFYVFSAIILLLKLLKVIDMEYNNFVSKIIHYSNVSTKSCQAMDPKVIHYYDLTLVLEGTMTYIINNRTIIIKKNEAMFLPPGTLRERIGNNTLTKYISFNFLIPEDSELSFDVIIPNCITPTIKKLLTVYPYATVLHPFFSYGKIANILNLVVSELCEASFWGSNNAHIINIYRYINKNLDKKICIDDISRELRLSREYIMRIFKRETQKTITEYINAQKMTLAKELIQSHTMSLSNIATSLGYDNYNYFSRLFKKHFKTNPTAFKK